MSDCPLPKASHALGLGCNLNQLERLKYPPVGSNFSKMMPFFLANLFGGTH